MKTHQFTLIVDAPGLQSPEHVDALFEAGCDDALVGRSDGVQYIDFEREAESPVEAALSAIAAIESAVKGAEVVRVAGGGLVSMADIAELTGRTREGVRLWVKGERGAGGFPPPVTDPRSRYRLWRWAEVRSWLEQALGQPLSRPDLDAYEALNASLELRRCTRNLPAETRHRILDLVA